MKQKDLLLEVIIYVSAKCHKGKTSAWGAKQILDYRTQQGTDDGYTMTARLFTTADSFTG